MTRTKEQRRRVPVAPARWTPELYAAVAEGERRAFGALMKGGLDDVLAATAGASERAAALERAALAREPPPVPYACSKGCSACCVSKVVVIAPEVIRVVVHLRGTLAPGALDALLVRVRRADERTRGLSRLDRAVTRVPCPLLVDDACSVHEVRPLLCRGWTSLSAAACARHFADPQDVAVAPAYVPAYELASAVLAGLGRAALDAGRDGMLLELIAALRTGLERTNAVERWLAGMPVFLRARDVEPSSG